MASGSTSISGLPYPNSNDAFTASADVQALAAALDSKVVLQFASAQDRSTKAATAQDGAWAYLRDEKRYYTFSAAAGAWVWPDWAQGILARADFVDSAPRTPLSNQPVGLPAFNVSVPNLPSGRLIRVSFSAMIGADNPSVYGFVLVFAGIQRRVSVNLMLSAVSTGITQSYVFTSGTSLQNATGGVLTGALLAGNGPVYLNSTGIDGPAQFIVEDLGAA